MKNKRTKTSNRNKSRSTRPGTSRSATSRAAKSSQFVNMRERVNELEETLRAIRSGEVDAVVVNAPKGDQVFTLQGAEHPYRLLVEDAARAAADVRKLDPFFKADSFGSLFRNPDHQAKIASALRKAGL